MNISDDEVAALLRPLPGELDAQSSEDSKRENRTAPGSDEQPTARVERDLVEGSLLQDSSTKAFSTVAIRPSTAAEHSTAANPVSSGVPTWKVKEFAVAHGWPSDKELPKPSFVVWALRLGVESGNLTPFPVRRRLLPNSVSETTRSVYDGFVYLVACRWLHTPGGGAGFDRNFAAMWCDVSPAQAKGARAELVGLDAIRHVGSHGRLKLWLPTEEVVDA